MSAEKFVKKTLAPGSVPYDLTIKDWYNMMEMYASERAMSVEEPTSKKKRNGFIKGVREFMEISRGSKRVILFGTRKQCLDQMKKKYPDWEEVKTPSQ